MLAVHEITQHKGCGFMVSEPLAKSRLLICCRLDVKSPGSILIDADFNAFLQIKFPRTI